jgi:hypothetical protein
MKRTLCIVFIFGIIFLFIPSSFAATGKTGQASLSISKSHDVDRRIPRTGLENKYGIAVIIGNREYKSRDVPRVDEERSYSSEEFGRWLVDMPLSERTVKILPYQVVK